MTTTILLADNNADFLKGRAEFLQQEGWYVITANTLGEAETLLQLPYLDLAILDIRLEDDKDEQDKSGLELAKSIGKSLPIIMLTEYPSVDYVRKALHPDDSAAVDFIAKAEGGDVLVEAVYKVLNKRRIFVVRSQNQSMDEDVIGFIKQLGLETIILPDETVKDNMIVEYFDNYIANISFAVVIMPADNIGYIDGKLRAPQNIIFELGYFVAKLGRSNIAPLYAAEDMELPSELDGILYTTGSDAKTWKKRLADNMRSAGIELNLSES